MRALSLALAPALALTACATLPPPGKPALPDVQFRMRDFRLANGMRVTSCRGNAVISFVGDEATIQAATRAAGL